MHLRRAVSPSLALLIASGLACASAAHGQDTITVQPATMPRVATVSDRFQSYNIEMVEVTGGRFWKPYSEVDAIQAKQKEQGSNQPTGIDPNLFQYRPPINLADAKLRKLAAGLAPAYVRVSGTWQNTTFFQDNDAPAPATPPTGFNGVLTRAQWKGVLDFSRAVDARIVTSAASSAGTRDSNGVWTPTQAATFYAYTQSQGVTIAATEFINEPSFPSGAGVPKGYNGADYARDSIVFRDFLRKASPQTVFLGPGSVGEGVSLLPAGATAASSPMGFLPSEDMLKASGPIFDAFSYHFYGGVSSRCSGNMGIGTTADQALSTDWLTRTDRVQAFYQHLDAQYAGSKPLWLTETAQTACGGDRWASTFVDTFRYLHQLGTLARDGVQVVAHNTLAASDYALLDPRTLDPRPNYWAALLWRRTMGTTVLDAGPTGTGNLYLYAHCLRGKPGGVALLAINADGASKTLALPTSAQRMTLTATELQSKDVLLNGKPLHLLPGDALPATEGVTAPKGNATLPAQSITFFAIDQANNAACR